MIKTLEETNRKLYNILNELEADISRKKFICLNLDLDTASKYLDESMRKVQICDSIVTIKESELPMEQFIVTKNVFKKSKWKEL